MACSRRVRTSIRTRWLPGGGYTNTRGNVSRTDSTAERDAPYRFTVCPAWTPGRGAGYAVRAIWRPPQRVDENPNRAAGRADVLDFPIGDPVVDGTAAHTNQFAGLIDRDGFPVDRDRFDRHTRLPEITDHTRQTGAHRPTEHPLREASALRRDGYTDRATPPVTGGAKRSRYTGTVNDTLAVAVDCCAGYRGEETPRRFTFKEPARPRSARSSTSGARRTIGTSRSGRRRVRSTRCDRMCDRERGS